jgi:hypothetical protein
MSTPPALQPARLLQDKNRDGGGNRLFLYEIEGRPALLKEYRARGAAWRELAKSVGYRVLERKRGVTARGRCAVERELLALWRAHGFDVPAVLLYPVPAGFDPQAATWLEYCPGPTLRFHAGDRAVPRAERERELARFAATLALRQKRALETRELGLVTKHASLQHVLLHAGRQVHFDFESAHTQGTDVWEALADELSGLVRSLLRRARRDERELLGAAFLEGHADAALLREIAARGEGHGVRRSVRRMADRLRRPAFAKHDALAWVLERTRQA